MKKWFKRNQAGQPADMTGNNITVPVNESVHIKPERVPDQIGSSLPYAAAPAVKKSGGILRGILWLLLLVSSLFKLNWMGGFFAGFFITNSMQTTYAWKLAYFVGIWMAVGYVGDFLINWLIRKTQSENAPVWIKK